MPNDFGELEVGNLEGDDTIIELVGEEWHTQGDLLAASYGCAEYVAICKLIQKLFSGEICLVELRKDGRTIKKYIENDRESVFDYLETGEECIIWNE